MMNMPEQITGNWIAGRILKLGMEKLGDHVKTRRAGNKEVRFRD